MGDAETDVLPGGAGFFQRGAIALPRSVPVDPADDGYFGPRSVTWRVTGDLTFPVAGLRSPLLQALHPLAMAGVEQHSDWRADVAARFTSTAVYVLTTTFGDKATARAAAARVRKIHQTVRGVDPVTGQRYAADDPDLLLWVHAAFVDSGIAAIERYSVPLPAADADRFVAEMTASATLIGMPEGLAPTSVAELDAYFDAVRPALMCTPAAAETARYLIDMPDVEPELADVWQLLAAAAVASLPGWAAGMYGLGGVRPPDREAVRQVLGVLDAVYLGEPGVLEARQRITLRMRAAEAAASS